RCLRYGVIASGHGPGYGLATQVVVRTATTADCKSPCPPEPEPEDVTRANGLLAGQRYLMEGLDEHPLFFKSKKACRTYRRRHPIPQDDLTLR
ncbi:MAG: hypothetical protein KC933_30360, partial [Myxococcales bacterium]|nr:hypothetical protein [Myxococcales bacterium]